MDKRTLTYKKAFSDFYRGDCRFKGGSNLSSGTNLCLRKKWDGNALAGIKNSLKIKNRGSQYSEGNWLVIFCNADGEFRPRIIKREIMSSDFEWVILVGPSGKSEFDYYIYLVKDWNRYREKIFNLHIDESGNHKLK